MLKKTHKIDASDKILGRMATEVAVLLQGKNRTDYTPNLVGENKVIITNTAKVKLSRKKAEAKEYYRHSGYPGGIKKDKYKDLLKKDPNELVRKAVFGMLPKNKLRKKMLKNLTLYAHASTKKD